MENFIKINQQNGNFTFLNYSQNTKYFNLNVINLIFEKYFKILNILKFSFQNYKVEKSYWCGQTSNMWKDHFVIHCKCINQIFGKKLEFNKSIIIKVISCINLF